MFSSGSQHDSQKCSSCLDAILHSEAEPLTEGELDIGAYHIQVIHTPGHTKGSVMYYFTTENLLFTGDTILEDVTGPTYRPTGRNPDMKDSVKRFKTLGYAGDTPLYPGHGNAEVSYPLYNEKMDVIGNKGLIILEKTDTNIKLMTCAGYFVEDGVEEQIIEKTSD